MDTSSYLSLFLQECRDNCAGITQGLLRLEREGPKEELFAEVMRLSHSCKGAAATMGYDKMAEYFHHLEDVFSSAKDGKLALTPEAVDALLQAIDELEHALTVVEATGKDLQSYARAAVVQSIAQGRLSPAAGPAAPGGSAEGDMAALPHVRVDARKLDTLLDLSGELTLLRQQIRTSAAGIPQAAPLEPLLDRLDKSVQELAFHVTQSRLIPVDQVFVRFPRLVRDLARTQEKQLRFAMTGTDMELDKSVIDHLITPLIHLLRNAVDHGIETPAERRSAGKAEEGVITLSVRREPGYVVVGVEDDGKAIDLQELKKKAAEHGFASEEIEAITDATVLDLLCSARFSSSDKVTMISGRGVGLSAVKNDVALLGGRLALIRDGKTKRFELALPLNLSVIPVIFVRAGGSVYGVPFLHVRRLLQPSGGEHMHALAQDTLEFEGRPLPLLPLAAALGHADPVSPSVSPCVLVVRDGDEDAGLVVEEMLGTQEVMVKPVAGVVRGTKFYSGCSLLGDGTVALILDIPAVIRHSVAAAKR
jgi:two-component system chemotaxis sensor kinase CheA